MSETARHYFLYSRLQLSKLHVIPEPVESSYPVNVSVTEFRENKLLLGKAEENNLELYGWDRRT